MFQNYETTAKITEPNFALAGFDTTIVSKVHHPMETKNVLGIPLSPPPPPPHLQIYLTQRKSNKSNTNQNKKQFMQKEKPNKTIVFLPYHIKENN